MIVIGIAFLAFGLLAVLVIAILLRIEGAVDKLRNELASKNQVEAEKHALSDWADRQLLIDEQIKAKGTLTNEEFNEKLAARVRAGRFRLERMQS